MPRGPFEQYYSDEEFQRVFSSFNALYHEVTAWQPTAARKVHTDLFGEQIQEGQEYYKQTIGPAFDNVIKLSRLSMERLLYVVFSANPRLAAFSEARAEERHRRDYEATMQVLAAMEARLGSSQTAFEKSPTSAIKPKLADIQIGKAYFGGRGLKRYRLLTRSGQETDTVFWIAFEQKIEAPTDRGLCSKRGIVAWAEREATEEELRTMLSHM